MAPSLLSRLSDNHPSIEQDDYQWEKNRTNILLDELKMLLNSRVYQPGIEDISLVNESVLNYGINDAIDGNEEFSGWPVVLQQRIITMIARFEPRLTDVSVNYKTGKDEEHLFILRAYYLSTPLALELKWSACAGRFYFNE